MTWAGTAVELGAVELGAVELGAVELGAVELGRCQPAARRCGEGTTGAPDCGTLDSAWPNLHRQLNGYSYVNLRSWSTP